jgi:5'-nucleotidase
VILLVNDDGIDHPGLRALYAALRARTGMPVLAVVPSQQRSGLSHAITLDRGLSILPRLEEGFFGFAVDGTPTDCTKLGLAVVCPEPPKLVVSGINDGPNVGRSLFYSGTVGAAMEGAVEGYAGLAVNRDLGDGGFADAATLAAEVAAWMLAAPAAFRGRVLNLNIPAGPRAQWRPMRIAAHGHSGFREGYKPVRDVRDHIAWRLAGEWVAAADDGDSDAHLLSAGHPVATVLQPELNGDQRLLQPLIERLAGAGQPS